MPTFRILGQNYHQIGSVLPPDGEELLSFLKMLTFRHWLLQSSGEEQGVGIQKRPRKRKTWQGSKDYKKEKKTARLKTEG